VAHAVYSKVANINAMANDLLVQMSSVRDPLVDELASVENQSPNGVQLVTERSWEPGSHVDMKTAVGNLQARARVVYCKAVGPKKFIVGLNILSRDGDQTNAPMANGCATRYSANSPALAVDPKDDRLFIINDFSPVSVFSRCSARRTRLVQRNERCGCRKDMR